MTHDLSSTVLALSVTLFLNLISSGRYQSHLKATSLAELLQGVGTTKDISENGLDPGSS